MHCQRRRHLLLRQFVSAMRFCGNVTCRRRRNPIDANHGQSDMLAESVLLYHGQTPFVLYVNSAKHNGNDGCNTNLLSYEDGPSIVKDIMHRLMNEHDPWTPGKFCNRSLVPNQCSGLSSHGRCRMGCHYLDADLPRIAELLKYFGNVVRIDM